MDQGRMNDSCREIISMEEYLHKRRQMNLKKENEFLINKERKKLEWWLETFYI